VKRLIIADSHVGQGKDDAAAMCALIEDAGARGVDEVIYLGDAFQYLIGMEKFWTAAVREVLGVWRRFRQAGGRIVVVEGNRDFFLDEPDLAREIDWSGRVYEFSEGGVRYLLDHGDLVNPRDLQYRFWSRVSKSKVARVWARLLPKPVAVAIVRRMEAHLAKTNQKFRYTVPTEDLGREAERAWAAGSGVVFWGHFHTHWKYEAPGRTAHIIPAWLETRCAVLVEPSGRWQTVNSSFEPCTSSGRPK
jgi:UDP-2,3-diacylglucosamine pyrophosphatase LpxH